MLLNVVLCFAVRKIGLYWLMGSRDNTSPIPKTWATNKGSHIYFNLSSWSTLSLQPPPPSWPPVPDCMEQRGNRRSGVNGPIHLSLEKEEEESRCSKDRVTLDLLLSFVVDMITVIKFFPPTADRVWNNAGGRNLLINGNCAILIFF